MQASAATTATDDDAETTPTVSFRALRRARRTVEDFARTYLPLHGVAPLDGLCRFLDVLVWAEATIYAADEANEALCGRGAGALPGYRFAAMATLARVLRSQGLWTDALAAELAAGQRYWELERRLCAAMQRHDLAAAWRADAAVAAAAAEAAQAVARGPEGEKSHSAAAAAAAGEEDRKQQPKQHQRQRQDGDNDGAHGSDAAPLLLLPPPRLSPGFTPADVLAAHEAKSFDYRVLHHLLMALLDVPSTPGDRPQARQPQSQLRREPAAAAAADGADAGPEARAALLAFARADERLVDISDDLADYEDDVAANAFNVYRALLHLYGPEDAQLLLAAQIGRLEAERARLLAALPAWRRELVRAREAEAAAADGEGADRWAFPAPILDERAFREREREWERRQKHGDGGGGGL